MARDWEAQFREWARPPSKTEEERCSNAATAIRNAVKFSSVLRPRGVTAFLQGSYRNNTNVRRDSDVDIGILCTDTFFYELPQGTGPGDFELRPATYTYSQYKNDVESALVDYFGRTAVVRGKKAFDVHETTYHVEADVAPFFPYRRYAANGTYLEGVQLITDEESAAIVNWPEQHYTSGCQKNNDTGTRFKSVVRALKALSNEMAQQHVAGGEIPGFLIECLVWNVPTNYFGDSTYTADVKAALAHIHVHTRTDAECENWLDVSQLKELFGPERKWTRGQANAFAAAAWAYADLGGPT